MTEVRPKRGWWVDWCTALHCTALHCTALHCTALTSSHDIKAGEAISCKQRCSTDGAQSNGMNSPSFSEHQPQISQYTTILNVLGRSTKSSSTYSTISKKGIMTYGSLERCRDHREWLSSTYKMFTVPYRVRSTEYSNSSILVILGGKTVT